MIRKKTYLRNNGFALAPARGAGFTLVEVLVASTIGTFIALVAVSTLKAISASAEIVNNSTEVAAEVRFASDMIAGDLANLYRDGNIADTKLVGTTEESEPGGVSSLTFYTVGRVKARIDQAEGDVYEVEYVLVKDEDKLVLLRRLWPNPNKDAEPGGILTVIAEDIEVFEFRFFDGEEWASEWPEEMRSLPGLVEVIIAAKQIGRAEPAMESFIANFARLQRTQAGTFEGGEQEESGQRTER